MKAPMTTIKADFFFFYFLLSKALDLSEGFWKHADFHLLPELATSWLCALVI